MPPTRVWAPFDDAMWDGSVDTLLDNEGDFVLLLMTLQRDNWLLAELQVRAPMTDTLERSVIDGSPQLDGSWGIRRCLARSKKSRNKLKWAKFVSSLESCSRNLKAKTAL
jgi:hypothetical protein